jgi:hypothetical protein
VRPGAVASRRRSEPPPASAGGTEPTRQAAREIAALPPQRGATIAAGAAAVSLPALATHAIVAAISAGLIAYEAIRYAEARGRLRRAAQAD